MMLGDEQDPAAGHHGELVDDPPMDPRYEKTDDVEGDDDEVDYEGDDWAGDDDPWEMICRDQDWMPDQIEAKRNEVAAEITDILNDARRNGIAIQGLGVEVVIDVLIDRLFLGIPNNGYQRTPAQERALFRLSVAEEQLKRLKAHQSDIAKAKLGQPMIAGPGGLLVPESNRTQRRGGKEKPQGYGRPR